ncbi:ABC transporter permease [Mesoplasma seiffertii]|uniref:ABC transporter permease n=1 Tax=Mesoplasma seiffertii TaxID=28224 RepID=UPI00047E245A|nr:ABC transporter permease [Mesoplasma seiffertii]
MQKQVNNFETTINFPIFKRIVKSFLTSKTWIIMTTLCFVAILMINIGSAFVFVKAANPSKTAAVFLPIAIMVFYLAYFEIHYISSSFAKEMRNGVMNLEIRSGISKSRLFYERLLANKAFSLIAIVIFILLFFLIHIISPYESSKLIAIKSTAGLFFVLLFDMFLTSVLLLIVTLKSSVLMGVFGTVLFSFVAISPIMGSVATLINGKNISNLADRSLKYNLASRVNKTAAKYGEDSVIEEMIKDIPQFENGIEKFVDKENNEVSKEKLEKASFYSFDVVEANLKIGKGDRYSYNDLQNKYIYDLLSEGLFTEIENKPLKYITEDGNATMNYQYIEIKPVLKPEVKGLKTYKLMEELTKIINFDQTYFNEENDFGAEGIHNSMFVFSGSSSFYGQAYNLNRKNIFKGQFNYNKDYQKAWKASSSEVRDFLKILDDFAKSKYLTENNPFSRYNWYDDPNFSFIVDQSINGTIGGTWIQQKVTDFSWAEGMRTSLGQRTIQKIAFKLLELTVDVDEALYQADTRNDAELTAKEVQKNLAFMNAINPFEIMWKQMFNVQANQTFNLAWSRFSLSSSAASSSPLYIYDVKGYKEKDYSEGFRKFAGGRNYEEIVLVGKTFNVTLSYFAMLIVYILLGALGFWIFRRRIIR